eukprot:353919-Chlamydomonas_euryale.AAC.2
MSDVSDVSDWVVRMGARHSAPCCLLHLLFTCLRVLGNCGSPAQLTLVFGYSFWTKRFAWHILMRPPPPQVHIAFARLEQRSFPSEPPRGKGNRLQEASGCMGSAFAQLPDAMLRYVAAHTSQRSGVTSVDRSPLSITQRGMSWTQSIVRTVMGSGGRAPVSSRGGVSRSPTSMRGASSGGITPSVSPSRLRNLPGAAARLDFGRDPSAHSSSPEVAERERASSEGGAAVSGGGSLALLVPTGGHVVAKHRLAVGTTIASDAAPPPV